MKKRRPESRNNHGAFEAAGHSSTRDRLIPAFFPDNGIEARDLRRMLSIDAPRPSTVNRRTQNRHILVESRSCGATRP
jgi:hypothetical protein